MKHSLLCDSGVDTTHYAFPFVSSYRYTCRIFNNKDRYHPVKPHTSIRLSPNSSFISSAALVATVSALIELLIIGCTISVTSTTQYGSCLRKREFLIRVGVIKALNGRCITAATSEGDSCLRRVSMSSEGSGSSSESDSRARFSTEAE